MLDLATSQEWRDQEEAYNDACDEEDNKSNMSDITSKPLQTEGVQDTEGDISGIGASKRVKKYLTGTSNVFARQMTITVNAQPTQFNRVETYIVDDGKEVRVDSANRRGSNQDLSSQGDSPTNNNEGRPKFTGSKQDLDVDDCDNRTVVSEFESPSGTKWQISNPDSPKHTNSAGKKISPTQMNADDSIPNTQGSKEEIPTPTPALPPQAKARKFGLKKMSTLAPPTQAQMMVEQQESKQKVFV